MKPKLKVFTFTSCRPREACESTFSIVNKGVFHHCTNLAYALQDIGYALREIDIPRPYRRLIAATTDVGVDAIPAFYKSDIYQPDVILEGIKHSDYIFLELASANIYCADGFLLYKWQCDKYSALKAYLDPDTVGILQRLAKKKISDRQIINIASLLDKHLKRIAPDAQIILFSHIPHPPFDITINPNKSRNKMAVLGMRICALLGWKHVNLLNLVPDNWIVTVQHDFGLHIRKDMQQDFALAVAKAIIV